jgi:1,4-alpha-glucan branching enzyme
MGWMHDTLDYFSTDPVFRKEVQNKLTFGLLYAFSEKFILVYSHDEVVHEKKSLLGKMPGDQWQQFANLRLCLGYMFTHPGKKLLFMGDEFGQSIEWNFKSGLQWDEAVKDLNSQLTEFVRRLNELFRQRDPLHDFDYAPEGFEWVDFEDAQQSVISFIRRSRNEFLLVVCNMTPVPRHNYRVGVPIYGLYNEILNSDAKEYGGSGVENLGTLHADKVAIHGRAASLSLTLPPLSILVFALDSSHQND